MGSEKPSPRGVELRAGLKSTSIRIKFMYRGVECRETLRLPHTKANIQFAERMRGEILNAIELGKFDYAKYFPESSNLKKFSLQVNRKDLTVGDLLEQQFEIYRRTLAPSTLEAYVRSYETRLKPQWGDTLLTELTPAALRTWLSAFTTKARSIRQMLIPLRGALELALNDDLIDSNPLDRVKLQKILNRDAYNVEFETDPFTANEITALLAAYPGQVQNVFRFAFCTGMRPSEYMALRWESVDWQGLKVKVERGRVAGETRDELKNRASRRLVDLRKGALEALIAQKQYSALAGGLVFLDPATGKGWDTTGRLSICWATMMRRAKVRYRNPYQTRHTFASTLLSTGGNPLYVAKQMGHTDTTMITRTYGRWLEQDGNVLPDMFLRVEADQKTQTG
ncbi:Arm DNA-binding domain-containing protein [Duganella sp. BJB475]|uniref:Arm DNA-binding domain-containing protein n=1 Tax=Duganella sp. BJB475 TaxID=2233914 RepID=UPI001314CE81|nr:DUF3596 domain-containing protein [Duganella sp. BJB475]